jgi:Phage integrase family
VVRRMLPKSTIHQRDRERVRERPGARTHDLRHSFASFAVADGHSLFLIGKALGHKQARTTEIYAHISDDPIRTVADRTAAKIAAVMKPRSRCAIRRRCGTNRRDRASAPGEPPEKGRKERTPVGLNADT